MCPRRPGGRSQRARSRRRPPTTRDHALAVPRGLFPQTFRRSSTAPRPRLRREPAPARRLLRRAGRPHASALARRAAARQALSYNNLNDLSAARLLAREFDGAACVIVKHANPCGVAVAETIEEAYAKALAGDPVSAYGGVVVLTRAVTGGARGALAEQFIEVLFAPGYDEVALEALRASRRRGSSTTSSGARSSPTSATTSACSAGCSSRTATRRRRRARR